MKPPRAPDAKIVTVFVYPPIPIRTEDWQAHYDDDEPDDDGNMRAGRGRTEEDAILDLVQLEEGDLDEGQCVCGHTKSITVNSGERPCPLCAERVAA